MEIDSKKELQKLKGLQQLANNGFLVDALNKAQRLNRHISNTTLDKIALNSGNHINMDKSGDNLDSEEYNKIDQILLPKCQGPNKGKWIDDEHPGSKMHRPLALDHKLKRDEAKRVARIKIAEAEVSIPDTVSRETDGSDEVVD